MISKFAADFSNRHDGQIAKDLSANPRLHLKKKWVDDYRTWRKTPHVWISLKDRTSSHSQSLKQRSLKISGSEKYRKRDVRRFFEGLVVPGVYYTGA